MSMEAYNKALDERTRISQEIECLQEDIGLKESELQAARSARGNLQASKLSNLVALREEYIAKQVEVGQAPFKKRLDEIQALEIQAETKFQNRIAEINSTNYALQFESSFRIINQAIGKIKQISPLVENMMTDTMTARVREELKNIEVDDDVLVKLIDLVDSAFHINQVEFNASGLEKLGSMLFGDHGTANMNPIQSVESAEEAKGLKGKLKNLLPKKKEKKPKKTGVLKVLVVSAFGIATIGFCILNPLIVMVPYTFAFARSIRGHAKNLRNLEDLLQPLECLKQVTVQYRQTLLKECDRLKEHDLKTAEHEHDTTLAKLRDERMQVNENIGNVESEVLQRIDESALRSQIEERFKAKTDSLEASIVMIENEITNSHERLAEYESELRAATATVVQLRKEIEERYINLDNVGKSQLLLKSFFLGFDESEHIVSLDYSGNATLVMYSGKNSAIVDSFICMMIIQYLTNMLPNSLDVSICDTENAGTTYQVFRTEHLQDIINITALDAELMLLIKDKHDLMRERSTKIMQQADTIEDFNKIMLERDSLLMDYHIIIIQTPTEELLKNTLFLQLCRQGCKYGIIPIVFINVSEQPTGAGTDDKKKIDIWIDLLKAINESVFNFNSETGEITNLGGAYANEVVQHLTLRLKEEN